jgi:hypothetical protein
VIAGTYDTQLKNTFARIEALDWGGAVTPISTTTGSKEIIPGSQYGGTKPTEMIWLGNHEPNINTGASYGTAYQFAGMMKHVAVLYDNWCTANSIGTKHIKFAVCLSNPGGNVNTVAGNFYGIGTGSSGTGDTYDITKTGTRPMDYAGWDIYYPAHRKQQRQERQLPRPDQAVRRDQLLSEVHAAPYVDCGEDADEHAGHHP